MASPRVASVIWVDKVSRGAPNGSATARCHFAPPAWTNNFPLAGGVLGGEAVVGRGFFALKTLHSDGGPVEHRGASWVCVEGHRRGGETVRAACCSELTSLCVRCHGL